MDTKIEIAAKLRVYSSYHDKQMMDKIKQILRKVSPRVFIENVDEGMIDYTIPRASSHTEVKEEIFSYLIRFAKKKNYLFEFFVSPKGDITFRFVADF